MRYPNDNEIVDPSTRVPPDVAEVLAPILRSSEKRYRLFLQRFRTDTSLWREEPPIVVDLGAAVFMNLAVRSLKHNPDDFDAFRRAIGWEGGAAELAVWYVHFLYKDVRRGRMPFEWQWNELEPHIWKLIEDAEYLWHDRTLVPAGWKAALGKADVEEPTTAPEDDRRAPAEFFEDYRANNVDMSYRKIAARIGISYDALFRIKGEKSWVGAGAYQAAADFLHCRPEDLHPRNLPRLPRRSRTGTERHHPKQ